MSKNATVNVIVAGLGGQGVLTCADILALAAFHAGHDVKKAEVHGMSQRGGSVACDVRFGATVNSPMVPPGTADFLVVLAEDQIELNLTQLRPGGILLAPDAIDIAVLASPKCLNVALLGCLSRHLNLPEACWEQALRESLAEKIQEMNFQAFAIGVAAAVI
jgi:indolepyruvate ferredoxin oxidoreductase beta subunit